MEHLVALVGFSFVSSVTPGPNNILLWASGATFGTRRTLRHVFGTAIGIGAMALLVAVAASVIMGAIPGLSTAMKVAGSVYLVYLAIQIARAGALSEAEVGKPLGLVGAAGFQMLNPKAWIFALGAVTTLRPVDLPVATGSVVVALVMMAVIVPTALLWAGAGGALSRFIADPPKRRLVARGMGALLVASILLVWV